MVTAMKANEHAGGEGEIPAWALVCMVILGVAVMFGVLLGSMVAFAAGMMVVLADGIMASLVLAAAAGFGYAIFRRAAPDGTPPLLGLATAAALGLWMLSTAVLLVGSLSRGALSGYVWWPVIGAGVLLALVQAHRPLGRARLPERYSGASLVWVLAALAGGIWLAGAVMPPGWLGNLTMDSYDVLEYHLQVPREYYQAGHIQPLKHNIYSHYPLGVEMLFLLGMCLRGGPYEGMYLAKLIGGLFAVVAVAGAFGGLRRGRASGTDQPGEDAVAAGFRARTAVGLLATAPWVMYFSGLAMPELAEICYLTLALVWLRRWLNRRNWRVAGWIGAMLGASCAVKYLSVGLIAAPVLAIMLAWSVWKPPRLGQVALAGGLTAVLFSPWLIRNAAATGNPVFPLGTSVFGRGHLSEQCAQRWRDGHSATFRPPVPTPPDYQPPQRLSRLKRLSAFFVGWPRLPDPDLGAGVLLLAAATILAMLVKPRTSSGWDWALLAILAIQTSIWAASTRDMPARFISIAVAPLSLLCAGGLARLASVREVRWLHQSAGIGGRWGVAPAVLLLAAATAMNLASAATFYRAEMARWNSPGIPPVGLSGANFAAQFRYYRPANTLPEGSRLMLVGDAGAFYFPPGTIYATVFDRHPLEKIIDRRPPAAALREMGVTHVLVNWSEINRLTHTYGWPSELAPDRLREAFSGWPVVDELSVPVKAPDSTPASPATGPASAPSEETFRLFILYAVPSPTTAGST